MTSNRRIPITLTLTGKEYEQLVWLLDNERLGGNAETFTSDRSADIYFDILEQLKKWGDVFPND